MCGNGFRSAYHSMKKDELVQRIVDTCGDWFIRENHENVRGGSGQMTQKLYPYDALFSPIKVNHLTLKNRIVMAPMGNIDMCEETGRPNDKMLQYFFARAEGGVGLITTGLIPISHGVDHSVTEMGKLSYFPRIDRSRTVQAGWRDLAQGVHARGSRIFVQLTAGLGRVGNPQCLVNELKFPCSASMNPNYYIPQIPCMPLTDSSAQKIIKNAGQAAADALACGLDGVYLHGHEGYLLDQMTNPAFNRRKIGRYANWQQFGLDMVAEIRKRTNPNYPIMYRIDLSAALNETYGERMDQVASLKKFTNGRTVQDTLDYMVNLVKAGVDLFDVDLGCYDNWWFPHPPEGMPAGCFLDVSETAKKYFAEKNIKSNAGIDVPIVAVGKLGYPDISEQALRDGKCDMVMLGRPLLTDPDWCVKAYSGQVDRIRPCIGCQEGCINEFVDGGHPQCAVNPRTGFEDVIPAELPKAEKPKKICVVGAGPAGVNFAVAAAKRGHDVTVLEKSAEVGGKLIPGGVPAIKFDISNYRQWLQQEAARAEKEMPNFHLKLNCSAVNDELKVAGYDAVVYAVGTKPAAPHFAGDDQMKIVQGVDLLLNPSLLGDAKKVTVIGGGVVGCETAYWLAYEHGCDVSVVEMLPELMDGACTANRGHLLHYMEKKGVKLYNCAKVTGFEEGKVKVTVNISAGKPDPWNTWQPILPKNIENPLAKKIGPETKDIVIETDLTVFAMGGRADDSLFLEGQAKHVAPELYNIGDSFQGGRVLEANRAAMALAQSI